MKQLLLLICMISGFGLTAQSITFEPESISKEINFDDTSILNADMALFNTTNAQIDFFFEHVRGDVPRDWVFQICDEMVCYPPGTESSPDGQINDISAQETIEGFFKVSLFNHQGVKGSGTTVFKVVDANDRTKEYGSIDIHWNVMGGVSTEDVAADQIHVYPNPAQEYFMVTDDQNIKNITLYDLLGRKVDDFKYQKGAEYNLAGVDKGIYYVACYDEKGETLSTKRLMKN